MGRIFKNNMQGSKPPTGLIPDFGAIFMSSKSTKKECLQKNLFGLPSAFNSFVKHVKAGMLLFLFEYETRQLYGVYEAASDGAIDIIPHAYRSSGKKFPAQVKMKIVWNCQPLLEDEFFDAIKDNYYQAFKFHFGLSKDQVYHLLRLFHQKKECTEVSHVFSTKYAYQKEQADDLLLEDHVSFECTRTGHDISTVCTCCNHDELHTRGKDPITDCQLISSSGAPVTKKMDSVSYYQPYDPDKPYFHQFSTCAETGFMPFTSGASSSSPICLEDHSDELHVVTENVDSSTMTRNLGLGDFIPLESSPCTKPYTYSSTARISNPDCRRSASLSSRHFRYSDPCCNCGFSPHLVRKKLVSSCQADEDEDEECIYEASDRGSKLGLISKRLSVLEKTDDLYVKDHLQIGGTKDLELGDIIPIDTSPYTKPYNPTTRIPFPDCRRATSVSPGHYGYPESVHNCRFLQHRFRDKVSDRRAIRISCQNDEAQQFIYEANDRRAKAGTRSKKKSSVFSRLSFAPNDSRELDFYKGSSDESTLAIMEQHQRKHDKWSKEFNRKNFKGHEEASSLIRQVSAVSELRLTLNPYKRDAEGILKAVATIKNLKRNSVQRGEGEFFDKLDSQVAKVIDSIEMLESNSGLAEKVGTRQIDLESSFSTQKQSKRRKLIRPVFGVGPLSAECDTHRNLDSQLPCVEVQESKGETGSLVAPAESACVSDYGLVEKSLSLVGEGQVSCTSCEDGSDEMAAKEAVHEVPVEAGSDGCPTSREPETEFFKVE